MRWVVEVSSIGKTDLQKFCVEAESWQRALQAARAQRGEEGPMSGFSIELLDEGYRAVDPLARVRFVVKRAPDDMPITPPLTKDAASAKPASIAPAAPTSSPATKSSPPRPGADKSPSAPPSTAPTTKPTTAASLMGAGPATSAAPAAPAAASTSPAAVGSAVPGLPPMKLLSSREQNPTESSPLTYREYSFAVPTGTNEATCVEVLRAQLKLVDAHLANAKMGKLVNLAVFDVEFTGKPPSPPIATLSWKDWKGEPVIGYPRRGTADKQVKPPGESPSIPPPSALFPPPSMPPVIPPAPQTAPILGQVSRPPAAAAHPSAPPPAMAAQPTLTHPSAPPPAMVAHPSAPPPAMMGHVSGPPPGAIPSQPPPGHAFPAPVMAPVGVFQPAVPGSIPPPAAAAHGSIPPPAAMPGSIPPPAAAVGSVPPPAQPQTSSQPPPRRPSSPDGRDGLVRTPSGRFVRGRTTGDELITALFESMHDLHFLRDALDGGQFCLALATEVLPARAALIHFFDVEKREWVVACTRGKDTTRLLTLRTPESDELLREAARKRRAIVTPNAEATTAQRYQSLGGTKSMIIAPIMQAGRALGALEIINPLDGMPFNDDEGNAMTYIAEQYAEYLGSRGIVLDSQRIQNAATPRQ
jgi:hypothetical protein